MLQVKDAVRSSFQMLGEVFTNSEVRQPRLEEVVLSDDQNFWLVTVSFSNPDYEPQASQDDNLISLLGRIGSPKRISKTVKLQAGDGSLVGIKDKWA